MTKSEAIKELRNIRPSGGIILQRRAEAIDIAIKALKKEEKYHWHNLRKNPEDLPEKNGDYLIKYDAINSVYNGYKIMFYSTKTGFVLGRIKKGAVLAWREIEPFEEVE